MSTEPLVTSDLLIGDVVFLLQCLEQRQSDGDPMQLIEVRTALSPAITLGFSEYLRFLRRFAYVTFNVDERTLSLTARGQASLTSDRAVLTSQLAGFFPDKLNRPVSEVLGSEESTAEDPANPISKPPVSTSPSVVPLSSPAAAATEPIYARGEALGSGPAGTVYRALHTTLGFEVAIKEFSGPLMSRVRAFDPGRLKDAVGRQARLRHPAVVEVYDLDLTGPVPATAVALCEGGSLRARLSAAAGRPPVGAVLRMMAQILDALALAHESGISHGNIKAENVLFDRFGNARLSDFGIAALRDPDTEVDARLLGYLAPEQINQGSLEPNPATDLYAAGVLLYETLGSRPANRRVPFPPKLQPEAPASLLWVAQRMIAEQPSDRYPHAGGALRDFLRAVGDPRLGEPGRISLATRSAKPPPPPDSAG